MASKIMQLPGIYIRGAIATQTMAKMTASDKHDLEIIIDDILKEPSIKEVKNEFTKKLKRTIKGDYLDINSSEQEFIISIWRAATHLLMHHSYSYTCKNCNSSSYTTNNNKPKNIDRQHIICPSCNHTKSTNGQMILVDKIKNQYIVNGITLTLEELSDIYRSPIDPVIQSKKVPNYNEILSDKQQMVKWFSKWSKNYFYQILKENKITTTGRKTITSSGPADQTAIDSIVTEISKYTYRYQVLETNEQYDIIINILSLHRDFSEIFMQNTISKYDKYDIKIIENANKITVYKNEHAPVVTDKKMLCERVMLISYSTPNNYDTENDNHICPVESNMKNKYSKNANDGLYEQIREQASAISKSIMDIYSQQGDIWEDYNSQYKECNKKSIAKYLKISPASVAKHKDEIAELCTNHGLLDKP